MFTINNTNSETIIVNKSKFISFLYNVNNIDEIEFILEHIKKEYNKATHICYAYIVNDLEKAFDDGEPRGSAGNPILETLKKNKLNCVLGIVVRFFGGSKLGIGKLSRTYKTSISNLIKKSNIVKLEKIKYINIYTNNDMENVVLQYIYNKDYKKIYEKDYIKYTLKVNDNLYELLNNIKNIKIEIVKEIYEKIID